MFGLNELVTDLSSAMEVSCTRFIRSNSVLITFASGYKKYIQSEWWRLPSFFHCSEMFDGFVKYTTKRFFKNHVDLLNIHGLQLGRLHFSNVIHHTAERVLQKVTDLKSLGNFNYSTPF